MNEGANYTLPVTLQYANALSSCCGNLPQNDVFYAQTVFDGKRKNRFDHCANTRRIYKQSAPETNRLLAGLSMSFSRIQYDSVRFCTILYAVLDHGIGRRNGGLGMLYIEVQLSWF